MSIINIINNISSAYIINIMSNSSIIDNINSIIHNN